MALQETGGGQVGFQEIRLTPGVNSERTPTLNAAGITDAQFIRWKEGLVEKLGGWSRFYPFSLNAGIPRALQAWQDLNLNNRLAIGCVNALKVLTAGALTDITPQETVTNNPPNFSTVSGSPTVTIVDAGANNPNSNGWVFFATPVSIGGLVLSGIYPITLGLTATSYTITAASNATATRTTQTITAATWAATGGGQITFTTSSSTGVGVGENITVSGMTPAGYNGVYTTIAGTTGTTVIVSQPVNPGAATVFGILCPGAVPSFATTNGSASVVVTLNNHGFVAFQTVSFLVSTTVGLSGVTIFGNYLVQSATTNTFTITAQQVATLTTTGAENGGNVNITYFIAIGPQAAAGGWGIGSWGSGGWSTGTAPPQPSGTPITVTDYSLLNFGENLIANPAGGPLFNWGPESGFLNAGIIGQGPVVADGCFLAQPIQSIVAWGASFTGAPAPLRLVWCDAGNFLQWTPSSINFAGGFTISRGSRIVACIQGANQFTVHTDVGVWSGTYVGQPLVFAIIETMTGCGLVGRKAIGVANNTEYWMSQQQFFQMAAGGVPQVLACRVWDKVFQTIDRTNFSKVRFFANSQFNEIGWYFPVLPALGGTGENSFYVKYNTVEGEWDYGPMGRSAWIDQSILGPPIGTTTTGLVYQHETSPDADGVVLNPFILTADFSIGQGEEFGFVDYMIPDAIYGQNGQPQMATLLTTLFSKGFPTDVPVQSGPFISTSGSTFIEPRLRGRSLSMRLESQDLGSFWRIGLYRYRVQPDGRNP
jgi:hypothetical protein